MKSIFEKTKKYIIWFIIILSLLYFVPIPHRIKATVEGVMISGDTKEAATATVKAVEYRYLLKPNTAKGTVTVSLVESGTDIAYEVTGLHKFEDEKRSICEITAWRCDEAENTMKRISFNYNKEWTKVYCRFLDGEDTEFIACSDGSTETEVKEYFGYYD